MWLEYIPRFMNENLNPEAQSQITRIKSFAESATRILYVFGTALIILWLSGLEPKSEVIHAYLKTQNSYDIAVHYQKIQRSSSRKLLENANIGTKSKVKNNALKAQAKFKRLVNDKIEAKKKALELARVPYKLPAGIEVQVAIDLAPLLWMSGSLVFLVFLRSRRMVIYERVNELITQYSGDSRNLKDCFYDAPFWLAPIPRNGAVASMREAVLMLAGWKNDTYQSTLVFAILASLLLVQARVLAISYASVRLDNSTALDILIPISASALLVASALLIIDGFSIGHQVINDSARAIPTPFHRSINRRRFLFNLFTGATLSIVFSACNSTNLPISLRAGVVPTPSLVKEPRYKRKRSKSKNILMDQGRQLNSGLYRNVKTSVIHYVNRTGIIPGVGAIQSKNLRAIPAIGLSPTSYLKKTNQNHIPYTAESVALDYIGQGHYEKACQALVAAIQVSLFLKTKRRPCFRLYDLLAGVSTRYKLTEYSKIVAKLLSDATKYQEKSDTSFQGLISKRLVKWRNPDSKWSKAWLNQSKPIYWYQSSRVIVM